MASAVLLERHPLDRTVRCSPASCPRTPCSPPSSCCRRCPDGRPRRRSGTRARAPRTPSPGSRAGRSGPAASGCGRAARAPPSPWSWRPTEPRIRGSSRTGRPRPDRSSTAQRHRTATTTGDGDARPWHNAEPRHSRPHSPETQGLHESAEETADPCAPSSRWPPAGARAPPPAITRCSCSTSSATWSVARCAPATCTAPTDGVMSWYRWSNVTRNEPSASTSAAMPAPPGARSAALLLTGKGGVSEAANLRSGILSGACGFSAFVELPGSWRGVRGAGGGFPTLRSYALPGKAL